MELTQLKYFVTVAEELHFGNAARKLNMTQPPLSMQIKKLEEELESRLFTRTNRTVSLTKEGELLLKEAKEILNRAENAVSNVKSLSESLSGPLKIGFNEPAINSFLPSLLKDFRKKFPDAIISLDEMETAEQLDALMQCRINIGFARLFQHETPGMRQMLMLSERYLIALPAKHDLCGFKVINPEMLADEALIIFPEKIQPRLHKGILMKLAANGYKPKLIQEAVTKQTTLALVEAGMGIAFIPESISSVKRKGVEFRKFSAKLPEIKIYAIWRDDDNSPLLEKFIGRARQKCA